MQRETDGDTASDQWSKSAYREGYAARRKVAQKLVMGVAQPVAGMSQGAMWCVRRVRKEESFVPQGINSLPTPHENNKNKITYR